MPGDALPSMVYVIKPRPPSPTPVSPTRGPRSGVAVVEDGRVTELGTREELVAERGAYAALWDSWHGLPEPAER